MLRLSSTWIHRIFSGYLLFPQCIHVDEMWEPVFRWRHLQKLQLWHWWYWSMSFKYHHYICRGLCDLYVWIQRTVRSKYDSSCNFIAKSKFTNIPNLKMILIIKMRFQFCLYKCISRYPFNVLFIIYSKLIVTFPKLYLRQ